LLKVVLAKRGHIVQIADSGEQAISKLEESRFDVALIDFQTLGSEGIRIVNAFRGRHTEDDRRARFIALDSDVASHSNQRCVFDVVIAKPVDVVLLCEVIEGFETYTSWMPAEADITPVLLAETPSANGERRSFRRVRVAQGGTELTLSDGTKQACRVVDLSLGGAAVLHALECDCPRCRLIRFHPIEWLPKIWLVDEGLSQDQPAPRLAHYS